MFVLSCRVVSCHSRSEVEVNGGYMHARLILIGLEQYTQPGKQAGLCTSYVMYPTTDKRYLSVKQHDSFELKYKLSSTVVRGSA